MYDKFHEYRKNISLNFVDYFIYLTTKITILNKIF